MIKLCMKLTSIPGILLILSMVGCEQSVSLNEEPAVAEAETGPASESENDVQSALDGQLEIDPQALLDSALSPELLREGWISLFDGQSLFGWFVVGEANWRIEDGTIVVDDGEQSFLCTSFQLADYELQLDFRCDPETNSGVFLRTLPAPGPENVAEDCLELNIAPPDNPFPTGSLVQRQKVEPERLGEFDPTAWHTYHVRLVGNEVEILLDGEQILELTDASTQPTGHISLQHNQGRVEFRRILLRPVNSQALNLNENWKEDWEKTERDDASMEVTVVEEGLKLVGGLGQLQSKASFADFVLQAEYTLARPEVNSGIFFRCVRDSMLDGYECQVNHAVSEGDPLRPADGGAGAIFRRQQARIVVGDGTTRSFITLLANGPHLSTWVNGLQVVDFVDTRAPDDNPRRGLRLEAGPISLQGHDPTTELIWHQIKIAEIGPQ